MRSHPPNASTSALMSAPSTIFHPSCVSLAPFSMACCSSSSLMPDLISSIIIMGRCSNVSAGELLIISSYASFSVRCSVGRRSGGPGYGRTMLRRISSVVSSRSSSAVGRTPRSDALVHHAKQMVALMTSRLRSSEVMNMAALDAMLRVELTIWPQSLRASHQRSYACEVRKARRSERSPRSVLCACDGMRHHVSPSKPAPSPENQMSARVRQLVSALTIHQTPGGMYSCSETSVSSHDSECCSVGDDFAILARASDREA
mmetsp:Transcript_105/g.397  ORF Transcript_105/g.397 Transcript_105/m.397 type:complete len:260 (+) Transcript_105:309-1088(+)